MTSQLTARHPACSILSTTSANSRVLSRPRHCGIGIRVVFPDIAQPGRPQERIGHRMANHVRVGVPEQAERMLDPEPAQDQRSPLAQPMRVVPDPNPHVDKLRLSARDRLPTAYPYKRPARIVAFSPGRGYPDTRTLPICSHDDRRLCHFEKKSFKIGQRITSIPWWK